MADLSVERKLVKSPPELWTELSELETLARHLGELGEIRIIKLDAEHTVAWEGEHARGTVEIESSGWGTKVRLSAEVDEPAASGEPVELVESEQADHLTTAESPEIERHDDDAQPHALVDASDQGEEDLGGDDEAPYFTKPQRRARWWQRWRRREGLQRDAEGVTTAPEPQGAPSGVQQPRSTPQDPAWSDLARADSPVVSREAEAPVGAGDDADEQPAPVTHGEATDSTSPGADRVREIFETALDNLGQAHHRPFSRG